MFEQCTDTIVRQVDDIRRMVDEFSHFARMPKPVIDCRRRRRHRAADRVPACGSAIPKSISMSRLPRIRCRRDFDRRLISQALTNIIKNATEAIARGSAGRARQGRDPRVRRARGRRYRDRRDRQRHRPAEGKPQPAARALCDDAREGHRAWARHRRAHPRGARRHSIELRDAAKRFRASGAPGCACALPPPAKPEPAAVRKTQMSQASEVAWPSEILIVDDEADIRDLVAGILQDEGYSTRTARDSDDALTAIVVAAAEPGVSRYLAAGQQARRAAVARQPSSRSTPSCRS